MEHSKLCIFHHDRDSFHPLDHDTGRASHEHRRMPRDPGYQQYVSQCGRIPALAWEMEVARPRCYQIWIPVGIDAPGASQAQSGGSGEADCS